MTKLTQPNPGLRLVLLLFLLFGLAPNCSDSPRTAEDFRAVGMKAFLDGHYPEARANLLEALKEKTSDKELLYFTALAYQHDFIIDSAFYYMKRANLLHPSDRELTEQLYEIAYRYGEFDDARKAINQLIGMGDPLEKHIENLVEVLVKGGSVTNAYYYLRKWYLEFGLNDPSKFTLLASLASKSDSAAVAHQVLDSAITRWGVNDDMLIVRSQVFYQERKLPEAINLLRPLIKKYPENPDLRMNLANALSNQNLVSSYDEALTLYTGLRGYMTDPAKIDSIITLVKQSREELLDPQ